MKLSHSPVPHAFTHHRFALAKYHLTE